jgi:cobalt-zinc-cadmium efflux system outer membrane protein
MFRSMVPLAVATLSALLLPVAFAQPAESAPFTERLAASELSPSGLTLEAAMRSALLNNPQLRAAQLEVEAGDGAVRQASLLPNPSLDYTQEDLKKQSRTTTVLLSQPLELGGKRAARTALAQRSRDVAVADLEARRSEVRATAIQAFFDALVAQERVTVADESLRIAEGGSAAAARRVAAGKVSPTEETRARVAEANARIERRQAQADRQSALRALTAVMAVPDGSVLRLDGRPDALPPLPANDTLAQRLVDAPALRRAQREVQRAEAAYELERSRRIPDVRLSFGSKRTEETGRSQAVIGISVPLPVFDRNQGAQYETLRRRDAARALAEAEVLRLRSEVLQAADQLQAREDEVQSLQQDVLPGARSAYEAASRGFELGKFGFLDVLDAQRTWLLARSQYLNALSQAHRAAADLERRLGAPNGTRSESSTDATAPSTYRE